MNMNPDIPKQPVIVSLTSFPAAIPYAFQAIQSILDGSVLPNKVILYLTISQFGESGIPQELLKLANDNPVFEIRNYDRDIRSYRKLIPALKDFPDAVIVTVDDDVAYHKNMLRDLLRLHEQIPNAILAHRAKRIKLDAPYRKWRNFLIKKIHSGFTNIQTGVGGVLYPPNSLKAEMLDVELFTEIAPTTDDIWFWAAAVANGIQIVPVPFGHNKPRSLKKPKELSLKTVNFKSGTDLNRAALERILERFPLIGKELEMKNNTEKMDIDLVYLWVDGSDPEWLAKRNAFTGNIPNNTEANCKGRYTNNDELKYSLRSVEKYAPWIHQIFIITDNQTPAWLNTSNPKVRIVDLKEIMPPESLPCYNSILIECFLYKIPGLSEHFLYANDDMFINQPVTPDTFFGANGYPIIRLYRKSFRKIRWFWRERIRKKPLNSYRREIKNATKLVEKKYGTYYSGLPHHNIDAYLRSDHQRVVEHLFKDEMGAMLTSHTRKSSDIQRVIHSYVALAEKHGHLYYASKKESQHLAIHRDKDYGKLEKYNPLLFCMNDSQHAQDSDRERAKAFLENYFPDKSEFEK